MSEKEKILVVGGAGYIGSHTVRMLSDQGYEVIVLDNLIYGHRDAIVDEGVLFIEGNLGDSTLLDQIFGEHSISAVFHFAAFAYVGESVTEPSKYYQNNLCASINLLDAMVKHKCPTFIFSSTCATYGNPEYVPIDEKHPQNPINPYGASKLMLERVLDDYSHAYGLKHCCLRYFNASGASLDAKIGEDHNPETHLIPLVLDAAMGKRENITVFGTDYDTPDGTCIRDYIHILDLARAHILALEKLNNSDEQALKINLGTGKGKSVKEVIDATEAVTGLKVPLVYGERRAGDPPELVANAAYAKEIIGWEAEFTDIHEILKTAYAWVNQDHQGKYTK